MRIALRSLLEGALNGASPQELTWGLFLEAPRSIRLGERVQAQRNTWARELQVGRDSEQDLGEEKRVLLSCSLPSAESALFRVRHPSARPKYQDPRPRALPLRRQSQLSRISGGKDLKAGIK